MLIDNPSSIELSEIDESNNHLVNLVSQTHSYKIMDKENYNISRKLIINDYQSIINDWLRENNQIFNQNDHKIWIDDVNMPSESNS